jgi:hypothetical protein
MFSSSPSAVGNHTAPAPGHVFLTQADLHQPVYPVKTRIHCMWDTRPFSGTPIGIPTAYDPDGDPERPFKTVGCFCSLACAAAHNMADHTVSMHTRFERHALLELLHHTLRRRDDEKDTVRTGEDEDADAQRGQGNTKKTTATATAGRAYAPLSLAPKRECLDFFGGDMSIARFRATSRDTVRVYQPPVRPSAVYQMYTTGGWGGGGGGMAGGRSITKGRARCNGMGSYVGGRGGGDGRGHGASTPVPRTPMPMTIPTPVSVHMKGVTQSGIRANGSSTTRAASAAHGTSSSSSSYDGSCNGGLTWTHLLLNDSELGHGAEDADPEYRNRGLGKFVQVEYECDGTGAGPLV